MSNKKIRNGIIDTCCLILMSIIVILIGLCIFQYQSIKILKEESIKDNTKSINDL